MSYVHWSICTSGGTDAPVAMGGLAVGEALQCRNTLTLPFIEHRAESNLEFSPHLAQNHHRQPVSQTESKTCHHVAHSASRRAASISAPAMVSAGGLGKSTRPPLN